MGRLDEIGAVDIRDEAEGDVALAVVAQRLIGHDGSQIGPANADIDHRADALAGVAGPRATADAIGEGRHFLQDGVDIRHDILAVDHDDCAFRRAQRDVQTRRGSR